MSAYLPSTELLDRRRSQLVFVDLQDRLVSAMPEHERLIAAAKLLGSVAKLMQVPIHVTEHYPKGLGRTVEPLAEFCERRVEKVRFSAGEALAFPAASDPSVDRDQIVLAGLEAHVCLCQTALDLLSQGYLVSIVADAVASRRPSDREVALQRLRDVGASITTAESVVFEWCQGADAPEFKTMSELVKARPLDV